LLLSGWTSACRQEGADCPDGNCPEGQVCIEALCLDEDLDLDGDGIGAGTEIAWGLSPTNPDTDGDSLRDGSEWGPFPDQPADADLDGLPDAAESLFLDEDGDCIPDQEDPHNSVPDPLDSAKERFCPATGICKAEWGKVSMACLDGLPICLLGDVEGYEAEEGLCDHQDNDCDSLTDEGIALGTDGLGEFCLAAGICGQGVVECDPVSLGPICSTAPGGSHSRAAGEECNGLDDDCDGLTDEGMAWGDRDLGQPCDGLGECGEGTVVCEAATRLPTCSTMAGQLEDQSLPESCDGLDNDCDGLTDEELFSPDLSVCPQAGVCGQNVESLKVVCSSGAWVCDPTGIPTFTKGLDGWCDGLDNDCDGNTDEDFFITEPDGAKKSLLEPCGIGPCAGGKVVCSEDLLLAVCSTWINRSGEVCDGKDNDCNGMTDEGQEYDGQFLGEACKGLGVCGTGTVECSQASLTATCSTNPDGSAPEAVMEACDLLDNDCDGQIDEEVQLQPECDKPGVCANSKTLAVCKQGDWVCEYYDIDSWEEVEATCDGLDNDCDGSIDETLPKAFCQLAPIKHAGFPPARAGYAWTLAPDQNAFYLFGGAAHPFPWQGEETCLSNFWKIPADSGGWTQLPAGPLEGRAGHSLAYDPAAKALYVLGGRCQQALIGSSWRYFVESGLSEPLAFDPQVVSRYGHSSFVALDTGALVIVGGKNDAGFADSWVLGQEPTAVTPMPEAPQVAFAGACASSVANTAYIFGGEDADGKLLDQLVAIDLVTMAVAPVPSPVSPPPRRDPALACGPDRLLLFGGLGEDGEPLADGWVFDFGSANWYALPEGPGPRSLALIASLPEGLSLVGGIGPGGRWHQDRWLMNKSGWASVLPPTPPNLAAAGFALDKVGRRACFAGGFETGLEGPLPSTALWCLDLKSGQWQKMAEGLSPPAIFASLSFDPFANRLLLLGGGLFQPGAEPQPLSPICRFSAFDMATGQWSYMGTCPPGEEPAPGAIASHAVDVRWKDVTLWVHGGITPQGISNRLWKLQLDKDKWSEVETSPPLPNLYGHRIWVQEEPAQMLIVGGANAPGYALLVDLKELTWVPLKPFWLDLAFPTFFFDQDSTVGLVLDTEKPTGTQFSLEDSKLHELEVLTFGAPVVPVSLGASFFDPWTRRGLLFGGLDADGLARGDLIEFAMECD
jgi:hypothetical protein